MLADKLIEAVGNSSTAAVYVEDVFSTYIYDGTGASQTITNNIDLSTKGGLLWIKNRTSAEYHALYDTERGSNKLLYSNATNGNYTSSTAFLQAFTTSGFTVGTDNMVNGSTWTYTSWTFRKQPKFFDIVTYTGTGSAGTISHNLGSTPGMIIVKSTSSVGDWAVYHRSLTSATFGIRLNTTAAQLSASGWWNATAPTSSVFSVGNNASTNANGTSYVAYLFAHDAGGFGASGTDSVTACGSYTGNGSASGPTVTLGWEPQYVLVKMSSSTGGWNIFDNMRGIPTGSADPYILANTADTEATTNGDLIDLTPTGFTIKSANAQVNTSSGTYIYLAIRRGPMKTPTDATKVFSPISSSSTTGLITNWSVDAQICGWKSGTDSWNGTVNDRLRGVSSTSTQVICGLITSAISAETTAYANGSKNWNNVGFDAPNNIAGLDNIYWNFRRAPGFFDVVCYTGTGANRTVSHNLGVVPELIIVKRRSAASVDGWLVYSAATGNTKRLFLNTTDAAAAIDMWNNTSPTASVFSLSNSDDGNNSGNTYVAYLFASCPGVSKVGSYTGSGTTKQIDCGFSAGARFVLIKRTDSTGAWYVWDTARGLVSGNDPYLLLNSTAAEVTTTDYIDPYSAGFEISSTAPAAINASGGSFIYLAIA